jgi:hypothetical protein
MFRNRISRWLPRNSQETSAASCGFMACPLALQQGVGEETWALRRQLYQWALEQAALVVRPSIVERWQVNLQN